MLKRLIGAWPTLACLALLTARPSLAAWPTDPTVNLPVCSATGDQFFVQAVTDGGRGAIVCWWDWRDIDVGVLGVYAQHLLAGGAVDPTWPVDGRAVYTDGSIGQLLVLAADGQGGAIVVWSDSRGGLSAQMVCQHVLATGEIDPGWPAGGRDLSASSDRGERFPAICTDGAGGAIITWCGFGASDVFAQRVLANGATDPAWPADGLAVCSAPNDQLNPKIVADGAGGAIVTWFDRRGGLNYDVYAQHVLAGGAADPQWPANGLAVCAADSTQNHPVITTDGSGGAIIAWIDLRGGEVFETYAHHVRAGGTLDPAWPIDGLLVSSAPGSQSGPALVPDGAGGAVIAWRDERSGVRRDLYATRLLANGTVDPTWPSEGLAVCTLAVELTPTMVPDGAGGAIVAWGDDRSGTSRDMYAHHVLSSGAVDAAWPDQGRAISTAPGDQAGNPVIVEDRADGAILAWADLRGGGSDIYAQRVLADGALGGASLVPVVQVLAPNGGETIVNGTPVSIRWSASDDEPLLHVDLHVSRYGPAGPWEAIAMQTPNTGSYAWTPDGPATDQALVRVDATDPFGNTASDTSDADFTTPTLMGTMSLEVVAGGVAVHFCFADPAAFHDVVLERADTAGGPYRPIGTPLREDSGCAMTLDPDVVEGRTYWYRIVARDRRSLVVTFGPVSTTAGSRGSEFALTRITPNPTSGPLRIGFELPAAAPVRISLVDLMGREVAMLAEAAYPAGRHEAVWSGAAGHGLVPAGLYFVRAQAVGRSLIRRVAIVR